MSSQRPFTISSFYKFVSEHALMAAKCKKCGTEILPPKPMCTKCLSTNLNWIEMEDTGKLLGYTIIHIAPEQFQSMTPYTVGIIEFKNGLRLPGMICDTTPEELKVGLKLKICFNSSKLTRWPAWSRYYFRPI